MKISIIGRGNVGSHLYKAFAEAGVEVQLVNSRTLEGLREDNDVYMICVKDDVISDTCKAIVTAVKGKLPIIVHTAGTKPMSLLEGKAERYGVFYPMQTFTKEKELSYVNIPIFLEASDNETLKTLKELAEKVFSNVKVLSSEERKKLHIAAVFCSNFTNHMVTLADEELQEIGLDYTVMLPLLDEVVSKLHELHPLKAQTGPAVRGDMSVVNEHLLQIKDETRREIYKAISESIQSLFHKF